jgi:hypothetical protein
LYKVGQIIPIVVLPHAVQYNKKQENTILLSHIIEITDKCLLFHTQVSTFVYIFPFLQKILAIF